MLISIIFILLSSILTFEKEKKYSSIPRKKQSKATLEIMNVYVRTCYFEDRDEIRMN